VQKHGPATPKTEPENGNTPDRICLPKVELVGWCPIQASAAHYHGMQVGAQANRSSTLHARRWELCGGCIQRRLRQAPWMVSQLQRQSAAHIQIGRRKVAVMAEEPSAGERERLWAAWLKENPRYQGQQEKIARTLHCSTKNLTGRQIQLAVRNSWWASLPRRLARVIIPESLPLATCPR
jgi:hypothetical protein